LSSSGAKWIMLCTSNQDCMYRFYQIFLEEVSELITNNCTKFINKRYAHLENKI